MLDFSRQRRLSKLLKARIYGVMLLMAFEGGGVGVALSILHLLYHLYSTGEKVVGFFREMIANTPYHRGSRFVFGE